MSEIIPVSATVEVDSAPAANVESVEIMSAVGMPPSGSVVLHPYSALDILAQKDAISTFTSTAASLQKAAVTPEGKSKITANLVAGSDSLETSGYLRSSAASLGLSENGVKLTWVGEDTKISSFNGSIYAPTIKNRMAAIDVDDVGDTIPEIIKFSIDRLIKSFKGDQYSGVEQAEMARIHKANEAAKSHIDEIMKNSEGEDDGLDAEIIAACGVNAKVELVNWVTQQLRVGAGLFFQVLSNVMDHFGRVYIPEDDKPGRFVARRKLLSTESYESISLDAQQIRAGISPPGDLFVSRIIVKGVAIPYYRDTIAVDLSEGLPVPQKRAIRAIWPPGEGEIAEGGGALTFPTPPWLTSPKVTPPKDYEGTGLTSNQILQSLEKLASETESVIDSQNSFLLAWANNLYAWEVLEPFQLMLSGMPFNPDIQAGKLIEVKIKTEEGDVSLGKGLVRVVRHSMKSGLASTYAELSHVEMSGFVLPNK